MELLFSFSDYWWFYGVFALFVLGMLALDLGVFHKNPHAVSFKESAVWTIIWFLLALIFNLGLYFYSRETFGSEEIAKQLSLEFLTGFIVEKSLAVDNIFVFVMVFSYFSVPLHYQHRVLFYGILGALVFRAIFIALGSILMQYHWVVIFFGGFLIFTGLKLIFAPTSKLAPDQNPFIRLLKRFLPITPDFQGPKFFTTREGKLFGTPLLVALIFIELSDIIFAIDSVPAIFAITKEPLIVFTSNIFAIMGLRAMYFMLAGVVDRFHLLKYGLALVLIFVGLKMVWLNGIFDGKFPILWSLGIIFGLILVSVILSLVVKPKNKNLTL